MAFAAATKRVSANSLAEAEALTTSTFDAVSGTITAKAASAIYGPMGIEFTGNGTASFGTITFSGAGVGTGGAQFAVKVGTAPAATNQVLRFRNASADGATIELSTGNVLTVKDAGGTTRYTSTSALAAGDYIGTLVLVKGTTTSNGRMLVYLREVATGNYVTTGTSLPYDSGATINTGTADYTQVRWGKNSATGNVTFSMDECAISEGSTDEIALPVDNDIAFSAIGIIGDVNSGTSCDVPFPTGVAVGNLAILCAQIHAGSRTHDAVTGWTKQAWGEGGTGVSIDAHLNVIAAYTKVLAGTESGNQTWTFTGSAAGAMGKMLRYTCGAGKTFDVTGSGSAVADDSAHGANRSTGTSGAVEMTVGDIVVAVVAVDTDADLSPTAPIITATGITFGKLKNRRTSGAGSTAGSDGNIEVWEAEVVAGSATVGLQFAFTTAVSQCGPVVFLRLRETSAAPPARRPLRRRFNRLDLRSP